MQQVICINDKRFGPLAPIKKGDILTISEARFSEWDGKPVYFFIEYGDHHEFDQRYFAPLSDIDETTLVNAQPETATV